MAKIKVELFIVSDYDLDKADEGKPAYSSEIFMQINSFKTVIYQTPFFYSVYAAEEHAHDKLQSAFQKLFSMDP